MRRVLGFLAAFALVGAAVWALDPGRLAAAFAGADPWYALLVVLLSVGANVCWGESVRRLLGRSGGPRPVVATHVAVFAGLFGKLAVPVATSAGPVFVAYTTHRESGLSYERTLAAAAVVEAVSAAGALVVGVAGLLSLLPAVPAGRSRLALLAAVLVPAATAGIVGALLLYYRRFDALVVRAAAGTVRAFGRFSGRDPTATAVETVRARVDAFRAAVAAVAADRRGLLLAGGLTLAGRLSLCLALLASARALGHAVAPGVVLLAVPLSGVGNISPLPGGVGGVEGALGAVLVAVGGLDVLGAAAVVLLYRAGSYWTVLAVGGLASASMAVGVLD